MSLLSRIDAWLTDPAAFTQDQTADLLMKCAEALEGKQRKPRKRRKPNTPRPAPEAMRALKVIQKHPGIHISALGRALGKADPTALNAVRRLEARGLVRTQLESRTPGRPNRACYPVEAA